MIETDEIEAILDKIWDIHDKLSDAIHSISRAQFLNAIKALKRPPEEGVMRFPAGKGSEESGNGYVFVKDVGVEEEEEEVEVDEAKSLNAIRAALENLEDQLEFFHTVQLQQRAERDAAIARLEQSRIVLAMRLADHPGKKYKVLEEALAFVGDVHNAGHFITPEQLFETSRSQSGESSKSHEEKRSNILVRAIASSFTFAKRSLKLDEMGSLLGHAALVAISMVALFHLHPLSSKSNFVGEVPQIGESFYYGKRSDKMTSEGNVSSSSGLVRHLDVLAARG